jgi:hypothetical protein
MESAFAPKRTGVFQRNWPIAAGRLPRIWRASEGEDAYWRLVVHRRRTDERAARTDGFEARRQLTSRRFRAKPPMRVQEG